LDTNLVLSALLFGGRLAWLRLAWQRGQLQPLLCKETAEELLRALCYPKFALSQQERLEVLAEFLPYAQVLPLPNPWPPLPPCRDAKDAVFLALAFHASADALVSGDADILSLQGCCELRICTAQALREALGL